MAQTNNFSIARKGYNCKEVDEYLLALKEAEAQLRESYAKLRDEHDALCAESAADKNEINRMRSDCTALAVALKKLREEGGNDEFKAKYEEALSENEQLKAEIEALKAADAAAENSKANEAAEYSETASKMISEVAAVVQKLEKDARRKAEAITISAKMEQERANIIKSRVMQEVRSLIDMLDSYLDEHAEETAEE